MAYEGKFSRLVGKWRGINKQGGSMWFKGFNQYQTDYYKHVERMKIKENIPKDKEYTIIEIIAMY